MKQNAARNYFFDEIGKKMEKEDIYIVSADLAGPPFDFIREKYHDRYVPVGIAEQNLVSVACGIAMTGKKVIAYTSNPFIAFRAFDQVRNAVTLMDLSLTVVGVGTGFSISPYGTTHFITEDIAMMSLCPGLRTITVSDMDTAEKALTCVFQDKHAPCYIRFDKDCNDNLADNGFEFEKGWRYVREGRNTLIIGQGYTSHIACNTCFSGPKPSIMDIFMSPFEESSFVNEVKNYEKVIVVEEQQLRGGLGSIILEIMNSYGVNVPVTRMGIDFSEGFPEVYGSRKYWLEYYGIDAKHLQEQMEE